MVCAAVSVSYINKVGNDVDGNGRLVIEDEYTYYGEFNIAGSRAAAGWTLFASCACLFFHGTALGMHRKKYGPEFDIEKHNTIYSITVS